MSSEEPKTPKRRRKYRTAPEQIAAQVRGKAAVFNAALKRAQESGMLVEMDRGSCSEIIITEIRANRTF